MAKIYHSEGNVIKYSNTGSAISSGDVVAMNDVVGIATTDIAATTGVGSVAITGAYTVAKTTGTAWNVGDSIDWDASAGEFHKGVTPAAGDVTLCAVCIEAAASGAATGVVRLAPGNGVGQ